jgi:D-alanine-D-alanine ligase
MAKKLRVGVLFGGRSGEHEVSLLSAASILKAIDRKKFDVVPIGITKTGRWLTAGGAQALLAGSGSEAVLELQTAADQPSSPSDAVSALVPDAASLGSGRLDVVFPCFTALSAKTAPSRDSFELADIAYVGSGVLGSAAGMDKDAMKRLFAQARLPIVKHLTVLRTAWEASPRKTSAPLKRRSNIRSSSNPPISAHRSASARSMTARNSPRAQPRRSLRPQDRY